MPTDDTPFHGTEPQDVVPPHIHASIVDLPPSPADALRPDYATMFDPQTPFWRPNVADIARAIGWRWIILLPCSILPVGLLVLSGYTVTSKMAGIIGGEIKLASAAVAVSVSIVLWAIRNVVKSRKDPFCIHCGYSLTGLEDRGKCPECGRPYIFSLCDEFRKDPHFFETRFKSVKDVPAGHAFAAGSGPTPDDGTGGSKGSSRSV